MTIHIRRATGRDAAAFARIMGDPAVYPGLMQMPYTNEGLWATRLADFDLPGRTDLPLVAEVHGEVVGSAGLHPAGTAQRRRHVLMLGISVAPSSQGQGVGSALMTALCDYADAGSARCASSWMSTPTTRRRSACIASSVSSPKARIAGMHCATGVMWTRTRWLGFIRTRRESSRWGTELRRFVRMVCWLLVALLATSASAEERVRFASLDAGVSLLGFWFPADLEPGVEPAAAVALFHGCGGLYDRSGKLSERMRDAVEMINAQGKHALVVDSLTPRGEKELCTQRIGTRQVTQANRRLDALAAVAWLAQRREVDAKRIGLLGWSNGGSTVLAAINRNQRDVAKAKVKPAFAVAFYPGCEAERKRGFETDTTLLIMIGEADDWTPAAACEHLAAEARHHKPEVETFPEAYHGFDSREPVRLRKDVPNGVNPGQGVHVGGHPVARRLAGWHLAHFLAEQ